MKHCIKILIASCCVGALLACGEPIPSGNEFGIAPPFVFGMRTDDVGKALALSKPIISAVACCFEPGAGVNPSDGPAYYAVNGFNDNWWHSQHDYNTSAHSGDSKLNGLVPQYGAHWITIDLGQEVKIGHEQIGRLGYQRRFDAEDFSDNQGVLGSNGTSYEIYVSQDYLGWNVSGANVVQIDAGINTAPDSSAGLVWLDFPVREETIKFRYVQLRWRFPEGSTDKVATAGNLMFMVNSATELNYNYIISVYRKGKKVLQSLTPSCENHHTLHNTTYGTDYRCVASGIPECAPHAAKCPYYSSNASEPTNGVVRYLYYYKNALPPWFDPTTKKASRNPELAELLGFQDKLDEAADTLLDVIFRIEPPSKLLQLDTSWQF